MPNEPHSPGPGVVDDFTVECQLAHEFGNALAAAAEACWRLPGKLEAARERDRRDPLPPGQPSRVDRLRSEWHGYIRRTITLQSLSLDVFEQGDERMTETGP